MEDSAVVGQSSTYWGVPVLLKGVHVLLSSSRATEKTPGANEEQVLLVSLRDL